MLRNLDLPRDISAKNKAPTLHRLLEYPALQAHITGGKGVRHPKHKAPCDSLNQKTRCLRSRRLRMGCNYQNFQQTKSILLEKYTTLGVCRISLLNHGTIIRSHLSFYSRINESDWIMRRRDSTPGMFKGARCTPDLALVPLGLQSTNEFC